MSAILVIEDDPGVLSVLGEILDMEGITARFARDGQEAINLAHQFRPRLVILDITLPIIGGVAVAHQIRRLYQDVPILVITADGYAEQKAADAGATALLQKPFELPAFLDALWSLLDRHDVAHAP